MFSTWQLKPRSSNRSWVLSLAKREVLTMSRAEMWRTREGSNRRKTVIFVVVYIGVLVIDFSV